MTNCSKCSKNITKKSPGLECNKCGTTVHASNSCAELSNKQLNLLRSVGNIEWTCNVCTQKLSKRNSFIAPEDDLEDEDDGSDSSSRIQSINLKKLCADITKEMEKVLKREIKETNEAIQFCSDKVEDCLSFMDAFKEKVKELENKNKELTNRNKYLELRLEVVEQRINEHEQRELNSTIEIIGITEIKDENLPDISKSVASHLNLNNADIKNTKRIISKSDRPGIIQIQLQSKEKADQWILASKNRSILSKQIKCDMANNNEGNNIYVRRALTPYFRTLLWKAKQELKDSYKYIWCKDAKIMVRKEEKAKVHIIRSESDISKLTASKIL